MIHMPMNFLDVPVPRRTNSEKTTCRVVVVLGGVKDSLLRYYLSLPDLLVILFDNVVEVERKRELHKGKPLIAFSLGENETTRSVYSDASDERRIASMGQASTSLAGGFCGQGTNAELAARMALNASSIRDFCNSLPDLAFVGTKGKLGRVILDVKASTSGAVGNGARPVIIDAIVGSLLRLGIPVEVRQDLLGPMTFACTARRARPNYAVALLKTLYRMLKPPEPSRYLETTRLDLHNLPPVSENSNLRDGWILADEVARDSQAMVQYLDMTCPNMAGDGATGNISYRVTDFMTGLDRAQDIAGPAASNLSASLQNLIDNIIPDPLLLHEMSWEDNSRQQKRESVEQILERFFYSTDESVLDAIAKPEASFHFRNEMTSSDKIIFQLERLSTDFAVTPVSLEDFELRLKLISTFEDRLNEEIAIVTEDIESVSQKIEVANTKFEPISYRVRHQYRPKKRLLSKLELVLDVLRENWDRMHKLNAESQALSRALSSVVHEKKHHKERLESILQVLESHVPKSLLAEKLESVSTLKLPQAFPKLLRIPELSAVDQLDLLSSFAGSVTARGLAKCVGINSDRLEDIARAIVYGSYDVESPSHDARIRQSASDKVIYAIPPMEPKLEASLTEILLRLHPGAKVTFYDTLMFGGNVMRMRIQRFSCVGELFTGLVGHDLKVGLEDPLAALDSAEVEEMLRFFNARIEGDRVVFPEARRHESRRLNGEAY